ncbi:zinc ABC transporter substrate-binding protein [Aquamicrobium lusatiense]|uniref:metal ABC transporter substrate-binding protein n=1 Tax=Aquamicrobium lusatiense TaxID=89772 RepID=UPI002457EF59|nr:zinc ABC transporter substrate-binding protein [Aquamicrobium lusatiense]MDH4990678.1 zinc ABC transporter substrate-binding protein [Aquamicrobium lusatiense]
MSARLTRRSLFAACAATAMTIPVFIPAKAQHAEVGPEIGSTLVLTAHPAAFALASALTNGSGIKIEAVQPAKLPATRLTSYLSGRGRTALADAAGKADAVITFRSFWPEDPLYPHARRSNIRIVEIDAGRPLDGALNGIAIAEPSDDTAIYAALDLTPMPPTGEGMAPWLAPTGMGCMADVLAADLSRLDPQSAKAIAANLAGLKQQLLSLKAETDTALAEADDLTAIALSPHFAYLAADLGIELVGSITAAPNEWTPERSKKLTSWLRENAVSVVLLDAQPNDEIANAIKGEDARFAVLSAIEGETADPAATIGENLKRLESVFANGGTD